MTIALAEEAAEEALTSPTTVQIGRRTVTLATPILEDCWLIADAWHDNPRLAMGAALGLCWQHPRPPKARLSDHRFSVAEYGRALYIELREAGWPRPDVMRAAATAARLCLETANKVATEEVEAAAARFREEG